jgi:hypothetical protein
MRRGFFGNLDQQALAVFDDDDLRIAHPSTPAAMSVSRAVATMTTTETGTTRGSGASAALVGVRGVPPSPRRASDNSGAQVMCLANAAFTQ